jgi:hypothetical protein
MPILTDQERLGTKVADKYVLDAILGRGGMGTVFAGRHGLSGRSVAVKILHPQHVRDPKAVRRFLNEARATAAFSHPNVVDVLDVDVLDDGTVFLVFERLEGETVGALLAREGRLSLARTMAIALPILDALAHAHRKGIIHRDLKPDNVFLVRDAFGECPVLLDFGIAKMLDAAELSVETVSGAILGTPQYMAPEQALGTGASTPQVDVYGAGVLLFECLAGRRPIDGPNPAAILARLVTGNAPTLASVAQDVPENISAVIGRALASLPENRFANCEQLAAALTREAESLGVEIAAIEGARRGRSSAKGEAAEGAASDARPDRDARIEALDATLGEEEFAAIRAPSPPSVTPSFAERAVSRPREAPAAPSGGRDRGAVIGVVIAVAFIGIAGGVTRVARRGRSAREAPSAAVAAPAPVGSRPPAPALATDRTASVGRLEPVLVRSAEEARDASVPRAIAAREGVVASRGVARRAGSTQGPSSEGRGRDRGGAETSPSIAEAPARATVEPSAATTGPGLRRAPEVARQW